MLFDGANDWISADLFAFVELPAVNEAADRLMVYHRAASGKYVISTDEWRDGLSYRLGYVWSSLCA